MVIKESNSITLVKIEIKNGGPHLIKKTTDRSKSIACATKEPTIYIEMLRENIIRRYKNVKNNDMKYKEFFKIHMLCSTIFISIY